MWKIKASNVKNKKYLKHSRKDMKIWNKIYTQNLKLEKKIKPKKKKNLNKKNDTGTKKTKTNKKKGH